MERAQTARTRVRVLRPASDVRFVLGLIVADRRTVARRVGRTSSPRWRLPCDPVHARRSSPPRSSDGWLAGARGRAAVDGPRWVRWSSSPAATRSSTPARLANLRRSSSSRSSCRGSSRGPTRRRSNVATPRVRSRWRCARVRSGRGAGTRAPARSCGTRTWSASTGSRRAGSTAGTRRTSRSSTPRTARRSARRSSARWHRARGTRWCIAS